MRCVSKITPKLVLIESKLYFHFQPALQDIKANKSIIKYMMCQSYIQSGQYQDLIDAYHNLNNLESTVGKKFPAVYWALGQINLQFHR